MKPNLLLDVDGVLNVQFDATRRVTLPGSKIRFYPAAYARPFLNWAWRTFDVFWLTAWFREANAIAEWAGLKKAPVIMEDRAMPGLDWKLNAVRKVFGRSRNRTIWIEDGVSDEALRWIGRHPNFLYIETSPFRGIHRQQVKLIRLWLDTPLHNC